MLLSYDLDYDDWVNSPGVRSRPLTPSMIRGDTKDISIQFCRGTLMTTLPSGSAYNFGVKARLYGASVPYLVSDDTAVVTGSLWRMDIASGGTLYQSTPTVSITGGGGSGATAVATISNGVVVALTVVNAGSGYTTAPTVTISAPGGGGGTATATSTLSYIYTFTPNFNTTEMNDAVGTAESIECNMELEWIKDGNVSSTKKLGIIVYNDVNRGDEGVPEDAETEFGTRMTEAEADITALETLVPDEFIVGVAGAGDAGKGVVYSNNGEIFADYFATNNSAGMAVDVRSDDAGTATAARFRFGALRTDPGLQILWNGSLNFPAALKTDTAPVGSPITADAWLSIQINGDEYKIPLVIP